MGCSSSKHGGNQFSTSKKIDGNLKKRRRTIDSQLKILLLGAGDSGKSTIAKQVKFLHSGFSQEELRAYQPAALSSLINALRCLVRGALSLNYRLPVSLKNIAEQLMQVSVLHISPELREKLPKILAEKNIQKALKQQSLFYLPDAAPYFFENIQRVLAPDYVPTFQDVLWCKIKSMGISEITFTEQGNSFLLVDVGGQRSERRKWLYCFQDVTAIIFCVALSEYNLTLEEDQTVNRMDESLQLFKETCSSRWFQNAPIILFLNKNDIFEKKIVQVPLTVCFLDYTGNNEPCQARQFIEQKFLTIAGKKEVYTHVTVATDTNRIRFVLEAVRDTAIRSAIAVASVWPAL